MVRQKLPTNSGRIMEKLCKHCKHCGLQKPLQQFRADPRMRDGYRSMCLECHSKRMKIARIRTPERSIFSNMLQRCHNPKHPKFHHYGGRGITVCDEWRDKGGFARFLEHIGPRPSPKHSVDRIDNSIGYAPGNVRWATQAEQMNNTRSTVRFDVAGRKMTKAELATFTGMTIRTIEWRRSSGWADEQVVSIPKGHFHVKRRSREA